MDAHSSKFPSLFSTVTGFTASRNTDCVSKLMRLLFAAPPLPGDVSSLLRFDEVPSYLKVNFRVSFADGVVGPCSVAGAALPLGCCAASDFSSKLDSSAQRSRMCVTPPVSVLATYRPLGDHRAVATSNGEWPRNVYRHTHLGAVEAALPSALHSAQICTSVAAAVASRWAVRGCACGWKSTELSEPRDPRQWLTRVILITPPAYEPCPEIDGP
ncbi:ornithine carbamoyltransferase [Babesia caballi]|uniref:Ornithine carbamoyltransferase n=1 Tax=Babesia caballi TaxID=5871 RepID=A0AAV4LLW2_BABCB|nr:ornithine carbamoyltransferase [Babesia caballi]